ncbi:MAG: DUF1156 domain-containing protein [Methanobacteriaceae archaeon]|nr:DUF1156 domain-containing protein [Methanobacteriaceae archaeon]
MDKRFIEESFPVKEVSIESSREKYVRKSHVSNLHMWWSGKPLGSSRATNYAALIPSSKDEIDWIKKRNFIIELSEWKKSLDDSIIKKARSDIKNFFGFNPKILDPFAGRGSIPIESLRLGCETYSGDYNPIAVLMQKCSIEFPQKFSPDLVKSVEKYGNKILMEAKNEIGKYYPSLYLQNDSYFGEAKEDLILYGYYWMRTFTCKNPACESDIPLTSNFWLSKKTGRNIAIYPFIKEKKLEFKIVGDEHEPIPDDFDPNTGTIKKVFIDCPFCGRRIEDHVTRTEFQKGNTGERLAAIVLKHPKKKGKIYKVAKSDDFKLFLSAKEQLIIKSDDFYKKWSLNPIPDEVTPDSCGKGAERAFSIRNYGLKEWGDLFNERQKLSLIVFMDHIKDAYYDMINSGTDEEFAKAVLTYLAFALDRLVGFGSKLCALNFTGGRGVVHAIGRQDLSIKWDYFESNPFNPEAAGWISACENNINWINHASQINNEPATIKNFSAAQLPFSDNFFDAVFTDPPYYDTVPYAYLSDFFYVWLKRTIGDLYPNLFATPLTPKSKEIVVYTYDKDWDEAKEHFEKTLSESFKEINRVLKPNGIATIVYAHKTTVGWETVINALLDSGLVITASWPISTEMKGRKRAKNSAVLASSIYIIARKNKKEEIGWFKDVKDQILDYIPQKLDKLWDEGISGADFYIAAIGSAIEIFGKYEKIINNQGNEIRADKLLSFVRNVVTDYTVKHILHNGISDQLSPITKFYLLWRWNYKELSVPFDEARKLAQSAGIDLVNEWNKGYILKEKGNITVLGPLKRNLDNLNSSELIDVIHKSCILWKNSQKEEIIDLLIESGYENSEAFYKVAQGIAETLPNSSSEKKYIEGLLTSLKYMVQDMNEDNSTKSQTKLV